jgi:GT2 family glycosyltransferase
MKIAFIVTNFNNSMHTIKMCNSINKFTNDSPIVIVDNNSEKIDILQLVKLESDNPNVKVIYNDENIGYFSGLNIGIDYVTNKYEIDIYIVGNNDLIFQEDFLSKLTNNWHLFENYPIVSPNIITLDNECQNPHVISKVSNFRQLILDIYYCNYFISLFIDYVLKKTKNLFRRKDFLESNKGRVIYQGYGACYLIGPIFFKYYKYLFAPTFLMGEEFFLAYQLKLFKQELYYEPSIKVFHQEHASVEKLSSKKFWKISKSSHLIYKKYLKSYD